MSQVEQLQEEGPFVGSENKWENQGDDVEVTKKPGGEIPEEFKYQPS